MTHMGQLLWLQKDYQLCRSLWKNDPGLSCSMTSFSNVISFKSQRLQREMFTDHQSDASQHCHCRGMMKLSTLYENQKNLNL